MTKQKRARESTETTVVEALNGVHGLERPPIRPLDLAWVNSVVVNSAGAARRAAEIGTRRTVKKGARRPAALALRSRRAHCVPFRTTSQTTSSPGCCAR